MLFFIQYYILAFFHCFSWFCGF